ncbi:hypothetical protein [Dokdonella sp.]|uniref:hypothetical protein n=1 Tax=Dokdonella sp. TaxID=2291710 RepID=UPI0035283583
MSPSRWVNFCPQELILHHPSGVQRENGVWQGRDRRIATGVSPGRRWISRLPSSFKEIMLQA